jgi:hypothetical protein
MSTSNLDYFVICDRDSGTFFSASDAVILDTRWLNDEELEILNEGSDSERSDLCSSYGSDIEDLIDPNAIEKPTIAESDYDNKGDFSSSWLGQ